MMSPPRRRWNRAEGMADVSFSKGPRDRSSCRSTTLHPTDGSGRRLPSRLLKKASAGLVLPILPPTFVRGEPKAGGEPARRTHPVARWVLFSNLLEHCACHRQRRIVPVKGRQISGETASPVDLMGPRRGHEPDTCPRHGIERSVPVAQISGER